MAKAKVNSATAATVGGKKKKAGGGEQQKRRQADLRSFFLPSPPSSPAKAKTTKTKEKQKKGGPGIGIGGKAVGPDGGGTKVQQKKKEQPVIVGVRTSPRRKGRGKDDDGGDGVTPTTTTPATTSTSTIDSPSTASEDRRRRTRPTLPSVTPNEKGDNDDGNNGEEPTKSSSPSTSSAAKTSGVKGSVRGSVTPGGSTTKKKKNAASKLDVVIEEEEEKDGGADGVGGKKSTSRKPAKASASVGGNTKATATATKLKSNKSAKSNSKSNSNLNSNSKLKQKTKPLEKADESNKRKRRVIVDDEEESSSEEEEEEFEDDDDEVDQQDEDGDEGVESSYEPTQSSEYSSDSSSDSDDDEGDPMDSSSDDESADDFVPKRKSKAKGSSSAGRLTTKKRGRNVDEDDGAGEEKKEEEGPEPPPKKTRKLAKGWSFLNAAPIGGPPKRKRVTTSQRQQNKPASARSSNRFVYDAGDDLPVLVHPQDMFDDMVSEQLTKSGTRTKPLDDFVEAMKGRTLRVATMCSGTESPVLALDMLSKSIDDFYYNRSNRKNNRNDAGGGGGDENESVGGVGGGGGGGLLKIEHVFSCEIEPFKQAYIERNFRPPLLFRDVRELGNDRATTAYGALVEVPNDPGSVDLLVAGTSCVDYSNLNNEKKTIDQSGESGQTFRGMMEWVTRSECPLVILENVSGAPWDKKVEMFDDMGYDAEFVRVDTKAYYIPHTRQRGYLFAIRRDDAPAGGNPTAKKKEKTGEKKIKITKQSHIVREWKETVEGLARPASGALDDFMLSNDDPRVARGRERLSTSSTFSSSGDSAAQSDRAGRTDWTRCESRHQLARSQEALGDRRPLTGWSDAGNTSMPAFAWNEWVNGQVHRIHDLMDINTLRLAKDGRDCTYKTMVWNLSQNVDRDTMGKLGLCMCLTPTGVPYVTNRGGPLVGEELLLLQGIPADDLLLTRETEDNLKDLAGNAMSTTVVGACMLSALILGHGALGDRPAKVGEIVHNLVPRPLTPAANATTGDAIVISQSMGRYRSEPLGLGPRANAPYSSMSDLLKDASSSARKCISEGSDVTLPVKDLLRCTLCGHTSSVGCATPPRKYEEHGFQPLVVVDGKKGEASRVRPEDFRRRLLDQLPMEIIVDGLTATDEDVPSSAADMDEDVWSRWKRALSEATTLAAAAVEDGAGKQRQQPAIFRFSEICRSHYWTVRYVATTGARLELRIMEEGARWFLFAKAPSERGKLRDALERPVARMRVVDDEQRRSAGKKVPATASLLEGEWEICLPHDCPVDVNIRGVGDRVPTWESGLGLRNGFECAERYSKLRITVETSGHPELKESVDGEYRLLPKCGTACSSLHRRVVAGDDSSTCDGDKNNMWFFLESGRRTMPDDDVFVFSTNKHRTNYREYRDVTLSIDPTEKYRPMAKAHGDEEDGNQEEDSGRTVRAYTAGIWTKKPLAHAASASEHCAYAKKNKASKRTHSSATIVMPAQKSELIVPMKEDGWRFSPQIFLATVPVQTDMKLYKDCVSASFLASTGTGEHNDNPWMDVNLQKSKFIFNSLAFVTSRISVPTVVSQNWIPLENEWTVTKDGEQRPCQKCAPEKPKLKWTTVTKGKKQLYVPKEDVKEASAYEQSLKNRPHPWVVRLRTIQGDATSRNGDMQMSVGCNAVSLTQRSMGLLPRCTLARTSMLELARSSSPSDKCSADNVFDFRIVQHVEKGASATEGANFPKMYLVSNKKDAEADQPPNFKKFPLRHEQLRSLTWMLAQEASTDPFWEEEVSESCLPGLNWRAEGRFRRPVMTRGGIVADEVGYGKTAITLGLIDSQRNASRPPTPREFTETHVHTGATLVVVPSHLMGQWPNEVKKFLGNSVSPLVIKDMASFNNVTVRDIARADLVIVNFQVLSSDKYFARFARLAGVNASSLPSGKTGGRHFESLHEECTTKLGTRVKVLQRDCSKVFDDIEDDAFRNAVEERKGSSVRLDGKKSVYKNVSEEATKKTAASGVSDVSEKSPKDSKQTGGGNGKLRKDGVNDKLSKPDRDPWGLRQCNDVQKMKCPPLEMFFWDRLVIDEFHYLAEKANRGRVLTLVRRLNSTYRWALSGTPPHANFNDVQTLANLLGIHLGVDEALPGAKVARRGGSGGGEGEKTDMEKFASLLESHSMQWHERRHAVAQDFLNRFVRQNIAEIDEIPCEEHTKVVNLSPAERGIYLELATALQSLEMNSKRALKSRKSTRGDREIRMQEILEGSADAEEALLKRCTHFDLSHGSSSALEACERVIKLRKEEKEKCTKELMNNIISALRQRLRILDHDKHWEGTKKTEKGEVEDRLAQYINDALRHDSVSGGADKEVHEEILAILKAAQEEVKLHPRKYDARYAEVNAEVNGDDADIDEGAGSKKRKLSEKREKRAKVSDDTLYAMKFALREHMHEIRTLGKELCGRTRSLRYFKWVRDFQLEKDVKCPSCNTGEVLRREVAGVLSSCGHVGCLKCLHAEADGEKCIDKTCSAPVKTSNVVSAVELGVDGDHNAGGSYGAKLTEIVRNIKGIVRNGDRVIVFVQFRDLKEKVSEALEKNNLKTLQVKGTVSTQVKALDVLQKEKPDKLDPRVLLLTMDDESSAGVNLTTCNHAVFVHPLLADTQQQYEAYETQAIGRIRRYGQTKTVNIWRYFAADTIDTEILKQRTGRDLDKA